MPGHRPVKTLGRGELARLTGCNIETIRYYERIGILPDPPRSPRGYRQYAPGDVARLGFVMRARELGFSLEDLRNLLHLVDRGAQTCAEVQRLAGAQLAAVRARISRLQAIESVLDETLARCSGRDVPDCAIIDALWPEPAPQPENDIGNGAAGQPG